MKERVFALEHEYLGPVDLGNASAVPTENTEYIIAHKDAATPFLVEALGQVDKPVLIGYAAYCLRRIGSNRGKDAATVTYKKFMAKGEKVTIEERFARNELKAYLDYLEKPQ
jgi:hypothetical protein